VTFTSAARKAFRSLPQEVQSQLLAKLARYDETGAGDVVKLVGTSGARLRSGDYRMIFSETEATLDVVAVGHRREIYR
jgi:mRNA interferase RelE/StbE